MWCCLVELWGAYSVSANVSLVLPSALVSLAFMIGLTVVSDRYGRKKVLLATMTGNILSAVVWLRSTTFVSRRFCAGLSLAQSLSSSIFSSLTSPYGFLPCPSAGW
jgi:MFS family permease